MDTAIVRVKKSVKSGIIGKSFVGRMSGGDRYWYSIGSVPAPVGLTRECWDQLKNRLEEVGLTENWTVIVVRTDIKDHLIDIYSLDELKR